MQIVKLNIWTPSRINWNNCYRMITTLKDKIDHRRGYTDYEHQQMDDFANMQLHEGFRKTQKGLRDKDVGHVERGVYYPGKDLDISMDAQGD